jgi:hypothetical protein
MLDCREFLGAAMFDAAPLAPAAAFSGAQTAATSIANSAARFNNFGPEPARLSRRSGL